MATSGSNTEGAQAATAVTAAKIPQLVVIVGPTASGKSDLAMQVAARWNGEIICADSRTIYKDLSIGTAKPSAQDQAAVRHHLLDVAAPGQPFSAADFKRLALAAIADIAARGKLPIMAGGTGLYVDSVVFDYQFGSAADPAKRAELQKLSVQQLQEKCREYNIEIPQNSQNKRHLIRAIELGGLTKPARDQLRPNTIVVGISTKNDILLARIIKRTEAMLHAGVVQEAAAAGQKYGWDNEAMSGNIYRILHRYLDGEIPLQRALEDFVKSDLQLAKRQRTWFKRNPHIVWSDDKTVLLRAIEAFVNAS